MAADKDLLSVQHRYKDVGMDKEIENKEAVVHAENKGCMDGMGMDIHGAEEEAEDSHIGVIPIHKGREVEQHCCDR